MFQALDDKERQVVVGAMEEKKFAYHFSNKPHKSWRLDHPAR
jgi:hypothetical protein